jgi:hypothetical protein
MNGHPWFGMRRKIKFWPLLDKLTLLSAPDKRRWGHSRNATQLLLRCFRNCRHHGVKIMTGCHIGFKGYGDDFPFQTSQVEILIARRHPKDTIASCNPAGPCAQPGRIVVSHSENRQILFYWLSKIRSPSRLLPEHYAVSLASGQVVQEFGMTIIRNTNIQYSFDLSIMSSDIINKNEERQQQEGILNPSLQTSSLLY